MLFAHGHKFGGHALYVKDGKLKYVYNFLGENEQMITSDIDVPKGKVVLGVEFVKEKLQAIRNSPVPNQCIGTATLYINDQKVGEYKGMATQLGKFALCGEGLNIGRDGSAPVTFDYPGPTTLGLHRRRAQAGHRGCQRRRVSGLRIGSAWRC